MKLIKWILVIIYALSILWTVVEGYRGYKITGGEFTELIFPLIFFLTFLYGLVTVTVQWNKKSNTYFILIFMRILFLIGLYSTIFLGLLAYMDTNENKSIIYITLLPFAVIMYGLLQTFSRKINLYSMRVQFPLLFLIIVGVHVIIYLNFAVQNIISLLIGLITGFISLFAYNKLLKMISK